MTLREVQKVIDAEVLCGEEHLDMDANSSFASDFMSDVLAFATDQMILMTGMINPQVVRTAQMMDMKCIIFVRGKRPDDEIIQLAKENDMVVMCTKYIMYKSCGMLYDAGLK